MRAVDSSFASTLWGMNGGQPESPDGKWLVYARKADLRRPETEIVIRRRDSLEEERVVFRVNCGNHNGPSATFTDPSHIVFRDIIGGLSALSGPLAGALCPLPRQVRQGTGRGTYAPASCH